MTIVVSAGFLRVVRVLAGPAAARRAWLLHRAWALAVIVGVAALLFWTNGASAFGRLGHLVAHADQP